MTQPEQQQLNALIEQLEAIQKDAPQQTVFVMGRTDGSVSSRLLGVIRGLKELTHEPDTAGTEHGTITSTGNTIAIKARK